MPHRQVILVDFENVHRFDLQSLPADARVYMFVGKNQKNIPFDLVSAAQGLGDGVKWVKVSGQGKNALDFHIAFYLGELLQTEPKDTDFLVLSKDTGYDPLVEHILSRKRKCRRVTALSDLPVRPAEPSDDAERKVLRNLQRIQGAKRPRTRKALTKHVNGMLGNAADGKAEGLVAELIQGGKIAEKDGKLTYQLEAETVERPDPPVTPPAASSTPAKRRRSKG